MRIIFFIFLLWGLTGISVARAGSPEPQVIETLRALPEAIRAEATVIAYVDGAVPLAVLHVPFATAESMGLSTEPDHYRPWLMAESTVMAHIMLPGQ